MNKKGYSLIELTIVVGLVSMLALVISAVVLSTIVSSNRIRNQVRIRQTGDYVIGQFNTLIRNARVVTACDPSAGSITVINQDSNDTTLAIDGTQIASSSAAMNTTINLTPTDIEITNYALTCLPSTADPRLIKLNFTVGKTGGSEGKSVENPLLDFSTSVEIRNR